MRIALYFINWNDSFYFPFIQAHYGQFCDKIVMYDNLSSDNSYARAKEYGWYYRTFGRKGMLNDQHYLDVKNHCWKECRGKGYDYVIVCDADEFIVPPLDSGNPFPIVNGFDMISDSLPVKNIFEINSGLPSESYSKQAIFNPDVVQEINYVHGCHKHRAVLDQHRATGNNLPEQRAQLYHFRNIGGVERKITRHHEYMCRMSEFNKKHKMGFHYEHSDDAKREEWKVLMAQAQVLY